MLIKLCLNAPAQQPLFKVEWICDNKEMHSCEDVFSFYSSSTAISQAICNTPEIMSEVSLNELEERVGTQTTTLKIILETQGVSL